jgi:hypothetical protein
MDLDALTDDQLRDEVTTWAGRVAAGEAVLLRLVGELDAREAWAMYGVLSCAHWSWVESLSTVYSSRDGALNVDHDWRDRVDHADERLQEVDALVADFIAADPYGIVRQLDGQMPEFTLVLKMTAEQAVPRRVSLLLAEIFGHLRSALDHLMCTLASANSGGTDAPPGTQFPIFKDAAVFHAVDKVGNPKRGSGNWQMRGASAPVRALIESLQPYHRGTDAVNDPLWLVHDFAVVDKHRKPHLSGAIAQGAGMGIRQVWGVDLFVDFIGYAGAFKQGTEVGRMTFTVTDPLNYMVDVYTDVSYLVAFAPAGPGGGRPVVETVRGLVSQLRDVVFPQLEPFV